ncbi:hypothetical protein IEQ34_019604 [Dendrobium chrysotoxum]|uniref:Uncharacterized protein n=1 Tax=Dendrobium chrysotoxum TaxID=161865 RepID=A0AAV7G859_DENCH|nr:hypothetical protein IEQ34_019604 [Dendrobium chrysotoxum]
MLLGCLCVLVCDDLDVVSSVAEDSLNSLFIYGKKILRETDFSELFMSLLERDSKMVQFSGSIDKLISSKPLSVGNLLSIAELKASSLSSSVSHVINGDDLPRL